MLNKLLGLKSSTSGRKKYGNSHSGIDFSFLGADVHSHIIPGIDDGPNAMEESIALVKELMALGYKGIVTTPHVKTDQYPNTTATINSGLQQLNAALKAEDIHFPVKAAAEYYIDNNFVQILQNEPLLTFNQNHVLIELSFLFEPSRLNDVITNMHTKGYVPVLAHAERYFFYHKNLNRIKELKDKGCLLQLNLISLAGYYSSSIKGIAELYIKNKLYDYCGSDIHHLKHVETLQKLSRSADIMHTLQKYPFQNKNITF